MKEHVEFIVDSFTDYAGRAHHFVIAAISQMLPTCTCQLEDNPYTDDHAEVGYEVSEYVMDYGTTDNYWPVTKVLRLGVSICNPTDTFDEKIGTRKAIARAEKSDPALFASNPGVINTGMVKALLEQEAQYLKNNPENFIPGYNDMKDRYLTRKEMESMKEGFSEVENQVVEGLQKDNKFLDKALKYLKWTTNQQKGTAK